MNISAASFPANASDIPIERLSGNTTLSEQQKVAETARQFEAVLLRQILTEAQKPMIKSKLSDNSTTSSIYRDMVGNQLADCISKSGMVGLASSLSEQLMRQEHVTRDDSGTADASTLHVDKRSEQSLPPVSQPARGWRGPL